MRVQMGCKMIDAQESTAGGPCRRLCPGESDKQRADQSGSCSRGEHIHIPEAQRTGTLEDSIHQAGKDLKVAAGSQFRDDTPVDHVYVLAGDGFRDHPAPVEKGDRGIIT